jgi:two-component system, chemotaxis family, chemotaxis protein CheY
MPKTVLLVGHCGPDSSYLKMTIKKAVSDVVIVSADDSREFAHQLEKNNADLILFNRELGYGFDPETGVENIQLLHRNNPNLKMILVSNYPEAQQAAVAAGALPGFGKRELGTPRVLEVLREAMGLVASAK